MSDKQTRLEAINNLRTRILDDADLQADFRTAFPEFAAKLLGEGELTDTDLDDVSGGGRMPWDAY